MITAGATLPFYNEPAMAQLSKVNAPPDAVLLNANENPLGPCKEAREAAAKMIEHGGRYRYSEGDRVQQILAQQEGVKPDYVRIYAGSSAPLHQAVLAFTGPKRPFVMADPGYESGAGAAAFIGSETIRVPLMKDNGYAHDVKAMAAASPTAGLIYICNPNNPTGTLTPASDIEWLVANKPEGSVVMIDEAYTHIAGAPFHTDMVAADKDVVVLRTFSKIYGMAGLRAGAAIARPDLLRKLGGFSSGMMPITGMAAASASLEAKYLIPERRKLIGDVREATYSFLDKHNFSYVRGEVELLHDRCEAPRAGSHHCTAGRKGLRRTPVAGLAHAHARDCRPGRRDEEIPGSVQEGDGVGSRAKNCVAEADMRAVFYEMS